MGILLYLQTLFFEYTYNDDYRLVVINGELLSHFSNIPKLFTKDVFLSVPNAYLYFRPMLNISFMLDAQVAGASPGFYHFTNIMLHVACSLLVFVLLKKLTGRRLAATGVALVFAVHPLLASSVAWIPGRNDSLLTLFVLASFIFFLRALEKRRLADVVLHFLFLGLALLTKESAVILPVMALLYMGLVHKDREQRKRIPVFVIIWLILTACWWYLRTSITHNFVPVETADPSLQGGVVRLSALLLYLGKAVFPLNVNLSVFPTVADNTLLWGAAAAVVLALLMVGQGEKNYRLIGWGMLWFFAFLAPSLRGGSYFLEHRAYCSMAGIMIAVTEAPGFSRLVRHKKIAAVLFAACVLLFGVMSFIHSDDYRNRENFSVNAYLKSPSLDDSYSNLASMFVDKGQFELAEKVIMKGLARNDTMRLVHRLLGDVYASRGENDRAEREYKISLRLEPLNMPTYVSYGKLCLTEGRFDEAEAFWRKTIAIEPDYILGYYLLANFYLDQRQDPAMAERFVQEIGKHGSTVMPELVSKIEERKRERAGTASPIGH